jgi:hypothetical protein
MADTEHTLAIITEVQDRASQELDKIGQKGSEAGEKAERSLDEAAKAADRLGKEAMESGNQAAAGMEKISQSAKKAAADVDKVSQEAEENKLALTELGPAGGKAMGIVGAAAGSAGAGIGAATAAASGMEAAFIGMGASLVGAFASGGPVGLAVAGLTTSIGFLIGSAVKLDEEFQAFSDNVKADLEAVTAETKGLIDEVERLINIRRALELGRDPTAADLELSRAQELRAMEERRMKIQVERNKAASIALNLARDEVSNLRQLVAGGDEFALTQEKAAEAIETFNDRTLSAQTRVVALANAYELAGESFNEDALAALDTLGAAEGRLASALEGIEQKRRAFREEDRARELEAEAALQERLRALQDQIDLLEAADEVEALRLQRAIEMRGLTEEEKRLKQDIFDLTDRSAEISANEAERERLSLIAEQFDQRVAMLQMTTEEKQALAELEEIDRVRVDLGHEAAQILEEALARAKEIREEEAASAKERADALAAEKRARDEQKRAAETRLRTTQDVRAEQHRLRLEIEGGVEAIKEYNREQERAKLLAAGVSAEEIEKLFALRDQLEAKKELEEFERKIREEAEKAAEAEKQKAAAAKDSAASAGAEARARGGGRESDARKARRQGRLFGVTFGGGLGTDILREAARAAQDAPVTQGEQAKRARATVKPAVQEAAEEAQAAGEAGTESASALAEKLTEAADVLATLKDIFGKSDEAGEKHKEAVESNVDKMAQIVADSTVATNAKIAALEQIVKNLERIVEQANASSGVGP